MKKLCTIIVLLVLFGLSAQAQSTVRVDGGSGSLAYEEGTNYLNIGIGIGRNIRSYNYGWWGGYSGVGASINGAYEIAFHDYFSAGPYAGIGRYSIIRGWNITAFAVGARGSFHYVALANEALDLGLNEDKLDLYVSIVLGAEIISSNIDDDNYIFENDTSIDFGTIVGGRYLLNERLGIYTELGYGALSVWTIGLTVNM